MSTERILYADPFDEDQINNIELFEKENSIDNRISNALKIISKTLTKEDYKEYIRTENDIEFYLLLESDNNIKDICQIKAEKDIKTCNLSFVPINKRSPRKIISCATEYALEEMGMEEVFIKVKPENKNIINYLESQEYENLGEEQGSILFLKEKEEKIEIQRKIA